MTELTEPARIRTTLLSVIALVTELARDIVDHGAGDEQEVALVPRAQDIVKRQGEIVAEINALCDAVEKDRATLEKDREALEKDREALEGQKQGVRDASELMLRTSLLDFEHAGVPLSSAPLSSAESELLRRHREGEANRPAAPRAWGGPPGEPNGNPDHVLMFDVGAKVLLLPPTRGRLSVDCSAMRIELTPDDTGVPGRIIAPLKRARYHDEHDTIEVDFDAHGRAVVDALRLKFVSAPV